MRGLYNLVTLLYLMEIINNYFCDRRVVENENQSAVGTLTFTVEYKVRWSTSSGITSWVHNCDNIALVLVDKTGGETEEKANTAIRIGQA